MLLRALLIVTLVSFGVACLPCDSITTNLVGVCHRADAGEIVPDASFVLEGESFAAGPCDVSIDGGAISLEVTGGNLSCRSAGGAVRAPSQQVKCTIPPLAPGTYTVNSQPGVTFTIPGDAGVRSCL